VLLLQGIGSVYQRLPRIEFIYDIVWLTIATLVPLAILTACNACLVRALQQSRRLQRLCRANNPSTSSTMAMTAVGAGAGAGASASAVGRSRRSGNSSGGGGSSSGGSHNRITSTLVTLIIVYIVCVGPSAAVDLLQPVIVYGQDGYHAYQTATIITNCLFLINFAANFILYCVVNVQFRRTARDVLCCAWKTTAGQRGVDSVRGEYAAGRGARLMGRRGRGTTDQSGRARSSLTYTVCTAIGSASCFDAVHQNASSDVDGRPSVGNGIAAVSVGPCAEAAPEPSASVLCEIKTAKKIEKLHASLDLHVDLSDLQ